MLFSAPKSREEQENPRKVQLFSNLFIRDHEQKFGFIKRVDKGWITTVKDLESWRFER